MDKRGGIRCAGRGYRRNTGAEEIVAAATGREKAKKIEERGNKRGKRKPGCGWKRRRFRGSKRGRGQSGRMKI